MSAELVFSCQVSSIVYINSIHHGFCVLSPADTLHAGDKRESTCPSFSSGKRSSLTHTPRERILGVKTGRENDSCDCAPLRDEVTMTKASPRLGSFICKAGDSECNSQH